MPLTLSRPSPESLSTMRDRVRDVPPTYAEVGATRDCDLPTGYHHDRYSITLGEGQRALDLGREALIRWEAHRATGAALVPKTQTLAPGETVVVMMRTGPLWVTAPCRIIYVTDEDNRFGFAYGTLPGHPERGEEAFHVAQDSSGAVTFDIVAFSRPADWLARVGSPLARWVQKAVTRRYLAGMRVYVTGAM